MWEVTYRFIFLLTAHLLCNDTLTWLALSHSNSSCGYVDNSPLRSELPTYPQLLRLRPVLYDNDSSNNIN